ncbi:hypothetical protein C8R43DRAFT_136776 [Mycena crocata]|nr:hypothetical protein C8R43DRAFT_136776 [Mycena crocata]
MARSSSSQPSPSPSSGNGASCEHCGASMRRNTDLPRHMLLHAKNKEEFMFTCPVEGCTHATLQKSNLATHIRTHTRAKPHKCPEYYSNGQKCDFATADPSSLHRHRKRKHDYQPRSSTTTTNAPTASGSGTREKSIESSTSFESEESFGLRPEASDADPGTAQESTNMTSSRSIHGPYLTSNKVSGQRYSINHYPPLDLKFPHWIGSTMHFHSTFHGVATEPDHESPSMSSAESPSSGLTKLLSSHWPGWMCSNGFDTTYDNTWDYEQARTCSYYCSSKARSSHIPYGSICAIRLVCSTSPDPGAMYEKPLAFKFFIVSLAEDSYVVYRIDSFRLRREIRTGTGCAVAEKKLALVLLGISPTSSTSDSTSILPPFLF